MFLVPGESYRGPLPPLTDSEKDLEQRLTDHIQFIAGKIGTRSLTDSPENLEKTALYIAQFLKANGCRMETQEFPVDLSNFITVTTRGIRSSTVRHTVRNIIGELPGGSKADQVIVIGAHYDSVDDCPAANDNGSGVAAMLEVARTLSSSKPNRTLRFVAFPNEEAPYSRSDAMGSLRYAKLCRERNENIAGMLSLETMAYFSDEPDSQKHPHEAFKMIYPSTGNFIGFVANWASRDLLHQSMSAFRQAVKFPSEGAVLPTSVRGVDFSDHWSFWECGYPALMVTDTAFYRYPYYHTAEDTPDKIDYGRFARVVFGLSEVVRDLAR